jgi:hypothetical protein
MKPLRVTIAAATAFILFCSTVRAAEPLKKQPAKHLVHRPQNAAQKKLIATRKMLLEKTRASRDALQNLKAEYEEKLKRQAADYEVTKIMYGLALVSKAKLDESTRELSTTRLQIEQARHWIAEDDVALSLAEAEAERLPPSRAGRYQETLALIRYNGFVDWSLAQAGKIAKFFRARFGRALPVSAMGQSPTHKRMGLDHTEAMDVAVRPDSEEGRELMAYLRRAGIPFIAFRNKVRGWATGAHIHIGRPSLRIEQVKPLPAAAALPDRNSDRS